MISNLPWWSFIVPVFIFGAITGFRQSKHPVFLTGFLSGFVTWAGANWYFNTIYNNPLYKIGLLLNLPVFLLIIIAGIAGGLLTGLALYAGKSAATAATVKTAA